MLQLLHLHIRSSGGSHGSASRSRWLCLETEDAVAMLVRFTHFESQYQVGAE
jgi:hypothetical protein